MGQFRPKIRGVPRETGLQRMSFFAVLLNWAEFSPEGVPAVRFRNRTASSNVCSPPSSLPNGLLRRIDRENARNPRGDPRCTTDSGTAKRAALVTQPWPKRSAVLNLDDNVPSCPQ